MTNKYHNTDLYLKMPYKRLVYPTGETGNNAYFAEVVEFNGCYAQGVSSEDALNNLDDAIRAYIEACKSANISVPEPFVNIKSSGKVLVRMSPNLHNSLLIKSKQANTSLNTTIVNSIIAGMQQI